MSLPDTFEIVNYLGEKEIIPFYKGVIDAHTEFPLKVRLGAASYARQRQRCSWKKDPSNKYYINICVEYSLREYVSWWLFKLKSYPEGWETPKNRGLRPSCGRIDHNKNYCFENIRLESRRANTQERLHRVGNPYASKAIIQIKDGKTLNKFPSAYHITKELGFTRAHVRNCCSGKVKTAYGFVWRYLSQNLSDDVK